MILLYTLIVGGMLWFVALQTALEPVANRRIFGELASIVYVVAFAFVWLTTVAWCAVERRLVFEAGGWKPLRAERGGAWFAQGAIVLVLLWAGAGALYPGQSWTRPKGPAGLVGLIVAYGLLGRLVTALDLPRRLGRWLAPFVPLVVGGLLYVAFLQLIDWADYRILLPEFHRKLESIAVFVGLAAFVALLLGWLLRRGRGEAPAGEHVDYAPRPGDVGWTLFPMLAPVVGFACLHHLPMDPWWESAMAGHGLVGLMFHALLVPALPAAMIVAWGLDRRDGSRAWAGVPVIAALAMLAWCAVGPSVLAGLHPRPEVTAAAAAAGAPTDPLWAWDSAAGDWVRLPVAGLVRATGAMMLALAALATTLVVRVGRGEPVAAVPALTMLLVVQVAASALIQRKFGPLGAPLGAAVAATAVWLHELWSEGARHETPVAVD